MQNQPTRSNNSTHTTKPSKSKSKPEVPVNPGPECEMYFDSLISYLLSLGLDKYKPGEELTIEDIRSFLQIPASHPVQAEETRPGPGDLPPFPFLSHPHPYPLPHPHPHPHTKTSELELLQLKLENDPEFAKSLKEEFEEVTIARALSSTRMWVDMQNSLRRRRR